jgi:hypothetical protein
LKQARTCDHQATHRHLRIGMAARFPELSVSSAHKYRRAVTVMCAAANNSGHSPPHSRDECRQPTLGRSAAPWRTTQTRHRCRTDYGRKVHGEKEGAAVTGLEDLSSQSCRRHRMRRSSQSDSSMPLSNDAAAQSGYFRYTRS